MINVSNVTLAYGNKVLFKDVHIKFTPGNCYGVIGANGAGKSTFLKRLSGDVEPDKGEVAIGPQERLSVLQQDHFAFEEETVIHTVIRGHARLYAVLEAREALYGNPDVLLLDEPTNHLDLESLTALNNGLIAFPGVLLLVSHDHQLISTVANRIVEVTPAGIIDRRMGFDEYLENSHGERMKDNLAIAC